MAGTKVWYDRLYFPKKPNEQAVADYLNSKQISELPQVWERGDNINRDVRAGCYLAQKKLVKVEARLQSKRRHAIISRRMLDKQWEHLFKKEEELREMFITFHEFVEENAMKRERAASKLIEQNQNAVRKIMELETIQFECDEMKRMNKKVDERIHIFFIFESFLRSVVDEFPEKFQNPNEVIRRYEALSYTKNILVDHIRSITTKMDIAKADYMKLINDSCVKLAGLRTRLADLNQRYESAKVNALKWEKLLLNIRSEATEKITDLTAIKESCWRMYEEICRRKGIEPIFVGDSGKQLDVIKKALYDFEGINKMARVLEEQKLVLSEKPCVSSGTE